MPHTAVIIVEVKAAADGHGQKCSLQPENAYSSIAAYIWVKEREK